MNKYRDFTRKKELEQPKNIYGKSMSKLDNTGKIDSIKIGDTLNHNKFGIGEVIDINNNILTMKFNNDIKKILYNPELFI